MRLFSRRAKAQGHEPVQVSEKHGVRLLHLGGPAVQSAMRIRDPYALELEYTRAMMAFLLFQTAPRSLALIGLGGGSLAKFIHRHLPEAHLTALEVNPEVVAAARSFFLLPPDDPRLSVQIRDGAEFVRAQEGSLDVLMVDGYDARRIVEGLASVEFYHACRGALRPGGVAVFNLWGSDSRFATYLDRVVHAFDGGLLLLPAEQKGNIVLFAFPRPLPDLQFPVLYARARGWETLLNLGFPRFLDRMRSFNPCSSEGFVP
jgi:spermidine synthase